jgi:hypothetical protein
MSQTPSIGRIVHYALSEQDAAQINKRREDFRQFVKASGGNYPSDGYVAHMGNPVEAGDMFPGIVIRVWEAAKSCNLHVLLDGNDTFWACSVSEGDGARQWSWPPRP